MKSDKPYILVSESVPLELLERMCSLIEEPDWFFYDYRKPMFPTSSTGLYDSILLRHSSEYTTSTIRNMPLFDKFALALEPIIEFIKQYYVVDEYAAFLARLQAGGQIAKHVDRGEFLETVYRLHIPLKTNTQALYLVDYGVVCMKVGTMYEIDNQRNHGVTNGGTTDRIHLIVNVYGKPLVSS